MVKGGSILEEANNNKRYLADYSIYDIGLHAEAHLLYKIERNNRKGGDIVIFRFNRADKDLIPRTSKPCISCLRKLQEYSFRVIYLNEEKETEILYPQQIVLPTIQDSLIRYI